MMCVRIGAKSLCAFVLLVTIRFGNATERNLLFNGDFEDGLSGWTTEHGWYEAKVNGKGTGISRWEVDEQIVRVGKRSIKVVGKGNRGIAMQVLRLPPATYRVRGWLKCENLGSAQASILIEFSDKDRKWYHGISPGSVSGTTDWTLVEKDITFPPETVWVHFDLLTTAPNNGVAWFDGVELLPLSTGAPLPTLHIVQKPADAGEVRLAWEAPDAAEIVWYEVYLEPRPFKSLKGLRPRTIVDWMTKEVTVPIAERRERIYVAVVPVSIDGRRPTEVDSLSLTVRDTKPPHPVELTVRNSVAKPNSLLIEWQPFPLDFDIRSFRLYAATQPTKVTSRLKALGKPFSAQDRMTWLPRTALPPKVRWLGMTAVDAAGNESEPRWQALLDLLPSKPDKPPFEVWVTSPLHNVFRDTPKPENPRSHIDLLCARNETECAQIVVTPQVPLTTVYLEVTSLVHETRKVIIRPENIAWNFVGYLWVEKNSTATPLEELLRKAPDDFPDPFLEERALDLKPNENQPIFVRVFVPKDATQGMYRGDIYIVTEQGSLRVPISVEVLPFALPDQLPIYVTNWFNLGNIARFHNVTEWSGDFWRILRLYAREMKRGHQNVVLTSLDLVKVWREEDGTLSFDFTDFDRWVRLFGQEGVAERIEFGHLGGRTTGEWECPTFSIAPRVATDRKTGQRIALEVEQFLPKLQRHLEEKGWLQKSMIHIGDEPIPINVASWREQSARAHRAAPKLKRIDAIGVPASEVKGYLEVLVAPLNLLVQWLDGYKEAQRQGAELWFYTGWLPQGKYPNRLIDYPCIKSRLLPWLAFFYGATGFLHWGLNFWTDFKDMGFAPGDNWIVYPGKWGLRSSIRWEAMRDGFEDFTCFTMLAQKVPERAQELMQQIVRSATDYDKDPEKLEQIRRQVARELAQ